MRDAAPLRPPGATYMPAIWIMAALMGGIEGLFQVLDLMGRGDVRLMAMDLFALRPAFAWAVSGDYPLQPFVTFVSHAFLHGNLLHLLMNVTIMLALGSVVVTVSGQHTGVILFLFCAICGGVLFAVLNAGQIFYLVGASGGVFGFMAAWKRWELQVIRYRGLSAKRVWSFLIWFTLINIGVQIVYPVVAWEAHLGGFIGGWLVAPWLRRRPLAPPR